MEHQWIINEVNHKLNRITIGDLVTEKTRFFFIPGVKSAFVDKNKIVALTSKCGFLIDISSGVHRRFDPAAGIPLPHNSV